MLLKLVGLGLGQYCADRFNLFDAAVVGLSLVELGLSGAAITSGNDLSAIKSFRSLRVLKAFRVLRLLKMFRCVYGGRGVHACVCRLA